MAGIMAKFRLNFTRRRATYIAAGVASGGILFYTFLRPPNRHFQPVSLEFLYDNDGNIKPPTFEAGPSRTQCIARLKASGRISSGTGPRVESSQNTKEDGETANQQSTLLDLLVIGAGATGSGIALDAASRGLKVGLVDQNDFASGTSSKSTKLVHGGVRYLEMAVWKLDYQQYKLVREALEERSVFLHIAPHLSMWLPIMLPVDKWYKIPYYWAGIKAYDILAGRQNIERSHFLSKKAALQAFPMMTPHKVAGAVVYHDGAHNDARMNISIAMTAAAYGATIANYVQIVDLLKDSNGNIIGAKARDLIPEKNGDDPDEFEIRAKAVVNATGPFSDAIRKLDDKNVQNMVAPSSGVHVILPGYYSPDRMGLIDPKTPDGRVLFFLPWQGNTIAGTTDAPTDISQNPKPSEDDIHWILSQIQEYISGDVKVRREDVLSAWSGIRPLVRDIHSKNTQSLARNHLITVSKSGLVTCNGGKWTTYRKMAEETVDDVIKRFKLAPKGLTQRPKLEGSQPPSTVDHLSLDGTCQTRKLRLIGSHGFTQMLYVGLIQYFGLETPVASHLAEAYGDRSWVVAALCAPTNEPFPLRGIHISSMYPFVDGEIRYAARHESAMTAVDVLARRTRLAFLNARAARDALPMVIDILGVELGWSEKRKEGERQDALDYLESMGLSRDDQRFSPDMADKKVATGL